MDCIKVKGIVARRADYSESNCILTIFTHDLGVISAAVYGVKSRKSKLKGVSQILCYSEFVLSKKHGEIYRVDSADIIESFYPVSEDLSKLALANYLCDVAADYITDSEDSILSLLLNTLYAISYKSVDLTLAKAVFEFKIMQLSGYEPNLMECIHCGRSNQLEYFDFSGGISCESCKNSAMIKLSADVKSALRYILESDLKKIFSFVISDDAMQRLALICEGYILSKSEKKYKSLEYYKKIL